MTQVHPNLEDNIENPGNGTISLIVGLGDMEEAELIEVVEELGGEYNRSLSFEYHLIKVPEKNISDLGEIEGIKTIEANAELEEFGQGK